MKELTLEEKGLKYDEMKEDRKAYNKRRNAKRNLLIALAIASGLDKAITNKDIDEEVERMSN